MRLKKKIRKILKNHKCKTDTDLIFKVDLLSFLDDLEAPIEVSACDPYYSTTSMDNGEVIFASTDGLE